MKVINIGAIWCPSCLVMKHRWEKIIKELSWLDLKNCDYDTDRELANQYLVEKEIPLAIFFDQNGQEFARKQGEIDRQELLDFILLNQSR